MSDVTITFHIAGKPVGIISSSLECLDSSPLLIPKRIVNKIANTSNAVEISFNVLHPENNQIK